MNVCVYKNLVIDQCSQRKVIKQVSEILPNIGCAILSKTFIVEPVYLMGVGGGGV